MNIKASTNWLLTIVIAIAMTQPCCASVKVNLGNGINISMENDALKMTINADGGGRISHLVDKKTGKDLVAVWKGVADNGGILDDRNAFTTMSYIAAVTQPGGQVGQVKLTAESADGMSMIKIITLREGESVINVSEKFSNGTMKPARFMVRNFMLPNGGPLTNDYQYFVPVKGKPLQPLTPADGYYNNLSAPWSAVWDSKTGEGILVAAPGIDKFYFWQGNKNFSSYEWVYPNVPSGKSVSVNFRLQLLNTLAPNWQDLGAQALSGLQAVHFADVTGWQNDAERYQITDAERARGFWLSTGDGVGKRRLPPLRIDVPENQKRSVFIGINALRDYADNTLNVQVNNIPKGLVQTSWQVNEKTSMKVLPFESSRKIELANGSEGRLWLTLEGGAKAQDSKGEIVISLNGEKVLLPIEVKVWPVQVPENRPFHVRTYGKLTAWTGGAQITPQKLKVLDGLFKYYAGMGGDVLNWWVDWPGMYPQLKIAGGDQTVAGWLKDNRAAFANKPVSQWPQVDFSYYDPWMKLARKYGITRGEAWLPQVPHAPSSFIEEEWILTQLKKYFQEWKMQGYFCKITDEIAPETIPAYIAQAKVAQRAGWRPFTTLHGYIPQTPGYIKQINPYLDVWQLISISTQIFDRMITQPYKLETKSIAMPKRWKRYSKGEAKDTFVQQLFKGLIAGEPNSVQDVKVFENGKLLGTASHTAWGNQEHGMSFYGYNNNLYVSSFSGTDANQSVITVQYRVRVPAKSGQVQAKIDPTDEVWFYGGGSDSYSAPYSTAANYPLLAVQRNYAGYGWYTYYRSTARYLTNKVVWPDSATGAITVSPAYLGLRDGWQDARLLAWLRQAKKVPVSQFISQEPNAPLRIGERQREIYHWKDIINLTDPFILNTARQQMLAAAVETGK